MTQDERRIYLIKALLEENGQYAHTQIPQGKYEQKRLLRGLMNVRPVEPISSEFLQIQDDYLEEELTKRGTISIKDLEETEPETYLWQGDITRLATDAIVNAANSGMTGCWAPNHACIDNCIHTYAGIQLRLHCAKIMADQGYPEPTWQAKITPAYNLPARYVIHTVGPIVQGQLTENDEHMLANCYNACLATAEEHNLNSIAFCCISTGVFGFPQQRAAEIATQTVYEFKQKHSSSIKVVFNVFTDTDLAIYQALLK